MSSNAPTTPSRRGPILAVGGGVLAVAAVVGATIVWPGLDAHEAPPVDAAIWALQTADGHRYARVNTAIGELDTVREVANPSAIAQTAERAYLYSGSYGKLTPIDAAMPADLDDEALAASTATPAGTTEVTVAGEYVVYRTETGGVYAGLLTDAQPSRIDPNPDPTEEPGPSASPTEAASDAPEYTADAVALSPDGVVYAYTAATESVLRYSVPDGRVLGTDAAAGIGEEPAITGVGDDWVVLDASGTIVERGVDVERSIEPVGSVVLARAQESGTDTYIADSSGLYRVPLDGSAVERVVGTSDEEIGTPARPTSLGDTTVAAWLASDSGVLWREGTGQQPLDFGGQVLEDTRRPVFAGTADALILNETRSGWVWTVPDAKLLPSSQNWVVEDADDQNAEESEIQSEVVLDPKPPVAEPDAFGVRPGAISSLPVLLNDHDPNQDVLSVDPGSITGLDPAFGTVTVTDGGGRLAVTLTADAQGSATFSYRVTDGTSADGLFSESTTVTLTAVSGDENTAPEWCGVEGCLATWPEPEVSPGGTVTVPVLNAWVDGEGDPLVLLSAHAPEGIATAAVTPGGEVVFQHADPSDSTTQVVPVEVTVADTRGGTAQRTLKVKVTPTPVLSAQSFTVVDSLGMDEPIDVSGHVLGTAGELSVTSVQVLDDADAQASLGASGTSFDFSAPQPGTYRVKYSVSDGRSEASATARVTLLGADAAAQLATAPVVAFLRPQEDATVDVLAAVSNPTRRVLLMSGITVIPDEGASLQVDAVAQNFIRVTGSTRTGDPGRLGVVNYTVSDGSSDAGATITGQATVYLLPPALDLAPIAVDDRVVVRAGSQIDIPVLDNDVAPSGAALFLDPSSVTASGPNVLAFAAGDTLRYLAPTTPGTYTVEYAIAPAGAPSLKDTATVTVTVLGDEANHAPAPKLLAGRVLSGQSVRIDFDPYGVDPDGDDVRLDRILTQPARGSAAISSDGAAIVYVSTPGSPGGQDSFTYQVVDAFGEQRTGTVRVGVLDQQSNPSPITFTDYVQVQQGAESIIRVRPIDNDIDPTNGTLALTEVTPNLSERLQGDAPNPEYDRWSSLIRTMDDSVVTIAAGTETGTMSFLYDVTSSSGNTGRGLIVVKVVRETVPDYPIVADTLLTVQNRDSFASGVDVLSGKVTWTGGDTSTLSLKAWGGKGTGDVSVNGQSVSGELTDKARVVPFAVTGDLVDGTPITTYAFVRVPAADDVTVSLRPGIAAQEVREKESITFDMASLVVMSRTSELEVSPNTAATGVRAQAACTPSGGTNITYTAGEGPPWNDMCVVPVRAAGQEDWAFLSVPIHVQALAPVPILRSASVTVTPGASDSFDLASITSWEGREDNANIRYAIDAPAGDFTVSQEGSVVSFRAADTALPGRETAVLVSVTSHPDVAPTRLILRVGQAPSTLPRAGNVQQQCSQAAGSSCTMRVTGAAGEVNPLPSTPLVLVSVSASSACAGVSFEVADENNVTASWGQDAPGGTCTAVFQLRDAQDRTTNGDRQGTITLDLLGYPRAPASISQSAFGDRSVTLRVDPGAARSSYPAVSGYAVTTGGTAVVTCNAEGVCPAFEAPNDQQLTYDVVAVNSVGNSRAAASTVAWAYRPPAAPASVTGVPVVDLVNDGKKVLLTITGVDTEGTDQLRITAATAKELVVDVKDQTTITTEFAVGSNTATLVSVQPITSAAVPKGEGKGETTGQSISTNTNGIGKPPTVSLTAVSEEVDFRTARVTVTATATPGGTGGKLLYGIVLKGEPCTATATEPTRVFDKVPANKKYTYQVCVDSVFDGTVFGSNTAEAPLDIRGGTQAPKGYTFQVDGAPDVSDGRANWVIRDRPTGTVEPGYTEEFDGLDSDIFGADPGIQVRWRSNEFPESVTEWGAVTPAKGSAPYQVWASWDVVCKAGGDVTVNFDSEGGGKKPRVSFDAKNAQYWDRRGNEVSVDDPQPTPTPGPSGSPTSTPTTEPETGTVPLKATRVTGIIVHVDWDGAGWGLAPVDETNVSGNCGR